MFSREVVVIQFLLMTVVGTFAGLSIQEMPAHDCLHIEGFVDSEVVWVTIIFSSLITFLWAQANQLSPVYMVPGGAAIASAIAYLFYEATLIVRTAVEAEVVPGLCAEGRFLRSAFGWLIGP